MSQLWWRELPVKPDGPYIFKRVGGRPHSFFLDSGLLVDGLSRYSYIGSAPFALLRSRGTRVTIVEGQKTTKMITNPFEALRSMLRRYQRDRVKDAPVPFTGGAVGYFSYDLGRLLEDMPSLAVNDLNWPDLEVGFYDTILAIDHLKGQVYILSDGQPQKGYRRRNSNALIQMEQMARMFCKEAEISGDGRTRQLPVILTGGNLTRYFSRDSYALAVERAKEYIASGDIYVINISQRFDLPLVTDPWLLYLRLSEISPAPFAAFLDFGKRQVVCSSPEQFLQVREGLVETRPIKGTRPRGDTPEKDLNNRRELWDSEKERAELVMVVDMERNDLGKVCRTGSVHVPELFRLEEYATVFHLVSTVRGELEEGKDLIDLLLATFPGGSVTGTPKVRAMKIIEELEPVRRGLYTGSLGYLGFDGEMGLNIVIRTIICVSGKAFLQVGGGITIDSEPHQEYQETLDKAMALLKALGSDVR